jgi:hypothetical protein
MTRRIWRAPLMLAAMLSTMYGVWLGLLRLGWILPLPRPDQLILHGPLMIGGFLGTLIGLERAVGIARPWAYAAPLSSAAGAAMLVFGPPENPGPLLITCASALVLGVFVSVVWTQPTLFASTMLAGAAAWLTGNALWSAGFAIYRVVLWWIAFLVLTIAGERLELNRLLRPTRAVRAAFIAAAFVVLIGASTIVWFPGVGVRLTGVGLLALSAWLAMNDIARRTIRQRGVTRYIAVCLLSGYMWLCAGGVIAAASGAYEPGVVYDALLHAVFLGFVMSMVFGHAPIVFPAITGRPMPFRPTFYAPLVLLHASVGLRLIGDLNDSLAGYRRWGGLLNAITLLAFVMNVATSAAMSTRRSA